MHDADLGFRYGQHGQHMHVVGVIYTIYEWAPGGGFTRGTTQVSSVSGWYVDSAGSVHPSSVVG